MKTCSICKTEKEETEFYTKKSKTGREYLYAHCKECHRALVAKAKAHRQESKKEWGEDAPAEAVTEG